VAIAVPAWLQAQGLRPVMAPIVTAAGRVSLHAQGFDWALYPYMPGTNGFTTPLSPAQWTVLGQTLAAVHGTTLPSELERMVPREDFGPRWRDIVRAYQARVDRGAEEDPIAQRFAELWIEKRSEIDTLLSRAEELAAAARQRVVPFVLCHTDLHAGNVLLGAGDELAIVDWDLPLLAPRERDLMFIGGGVGGIWNSPAEEALFYQGYGPVQFDLITLSYYRYERIIEDFAANGEQIFAMQGSDEDRAVGLRMREQFAPGNVVEIAHRTYERLA
jgi:spectinomycin phosphotransferase